MDSRFSTPSSNMSFILASALIISFIAATNAATFQITNQCSYTVWAAASPGGGRELNSGQSWEINVAPGTAGARIWGRTGCQFDSNGKGHCETGDCGGVLECSGYGQAPNTLAEYALKQSYGLDYFDISVVAGYNVPLEFGPTTGTSNTCRDITCTGVTAQCPAKLQAPGGCNNPCTVFNTNEYCCTDGQGSCGPTTYSEYFKGKCPDAYSYPQDTENTVYTCPSGTNYKVVFCP